LETGESKVLSMSKNSSSNNSAQKMILTETIFEIRQEPNLIKALELAYPLSKSGQITLKAKGEFIPNAITVANILTQRILKNKCKVHKVTVDSEPIVTMGSFNSIIEIVLKSSSQ
jgi:DNA-binding protein